MGSCGSKGSTIHLGNHFRKLLPQTTSANYFRGVIVTKAQILKAFGNVKKTSYALDVTSEAVRMWPDKIGPHLAARVIVASIRFKGVEQTQKKWPEFFPLDTDS